MGNKCYEFIVKYNHDVYGSGNTRAYCTFLEDREYSLLMAATKLELDFLDLIKYYTLNDLVKDKGLDINNKYVKTLLNSNLKLHEIIALYDLVCADVINYLDSYSRDNKPEKYLRIA